MKNIWTEEDFEEMGWHDSYLHAISFPSEDLELSLDIDYLFQWILDEKSSLYSFWVSPCTLTFASTLNLEVSLDFKNSTGIYINDICRTNPRVSANGNVTLWNFEIVTDKGVVKFESSGYRQIVKKQPIFSQSQVLRRNSWWKAY